MKKLLVVIVLLLVPTLCWAPPLEVCTSVRVTADGSVRTTPGYLCGVIIETNGSADATATLYPSSAKTDGTQIFKMIVEGTDWHGGAVFPKPVAYSGMYLDIDGTGAAVTIYYMAQ